MEEDIVLKIKEKESLEVVKYISIIYALFLFFLGAIMQFEETIIEVTFICVFAIIIDMINYGEFIVSEKSVKSKKIGFTKYKEIYRLDLDNRTLTLYTRNEKKPYKINFAKNEDMSQIDKIYKYIDAKIKRIEEDIKDHEEFVQKISK